MSTPVPRNRVRRAPARAAYDRETVNAILDEAPVCQLGIIDGEQPIVTPTLHARVDDELYLHGSAAGRTMKALGAGAEVCVSVTLVDGLVLARSAFHHSVNYRSVTAFGRARAVTTQEGKLRALHAFMEKLMPGRWDDVRPPSPKELRATSVFSLPLDETSAKVRTGPPVDDAEDMSLRCWAGVVPLRVASSSGQPDPTLDPGIEPPAYLARLRRP